VSSLSNSASINFIHSSLETLPLLFVSITSNSCFAASVAAASFASLFSVVRRRRWSSYSRFPCTTTIPATNTSATVARTIGRSLSMISPPFEMLPLECRLPFEEACIRRQNFTMMAILILGSSLRRSGVQRPPCEFALQVDCARPRLAPFGSVGLDGFTAHPNPVELPSLQT